MTDRHVAVLGAGSWGTALAKHLADKNIEVRLWSRREDHAEQMRATGENETYLPGFKLPATLHPTSDLEHAIGNARAVVCVTPSHGLRELLNHATGLFPTDAPIVSATKGIENDSLLLVSEIFEQYLPPSKQRLFTCLSGPSFAREVAQGIPTAVSIAGRDEKVALDVQALFSTDRFRVYTTSDLVGVELGGALKNVMAIAAGIADGLGFGHNTRAALITRGLAEMGRLAVKLGGDPITLAGLSGMGDLVLTCTGDLSRNRSVGMELARGRKIADIVSGMAMVAEGVRTAKSAYELAQREDVYMPIVGEIYEVLYKDKPPIEAVVSLMTRPARPERDDY